MKNEIGGGKLSKNCTALLNLSPENWPIVERKESILRERPNFCLSRAQNRKEGTALAQGFAAASSEFGLLFWRLRQRQRAEDAQFAKVVLTIKQ